MSAIIPIPRCEVTVRPAVAGDYAFIDRLQDMHSKALGFMRKAALEGKIKRGEVLIAEEATERRSDGATEGSAGGTTALSSPSSLRRSVASSLPLGYCISSDRYFKRDEVGIVYQMNVVPSAQRKLVAAKLLQTVFERAPYGCKLFCCWCAQDLDANYFWESLGFIPLAFRTGSRTRGRSSPSVASSLRRSVACPRVHIFWQRRIREGDTTTPYWFPSKTDGGMMREDRLVLPIPPGVHWKSQMPILIPEVQQKELPVASGQLPEKKERSAGTLKPIAVKSRRVQFGSPDNEPVPPAGGVVKKDKSAKPKREKVKADPKHIAAARELRDRYLEHVNTNENALPAPCGKYEVVKHLPPPEAGPPPLLEAA